MIANNNLYLVLNIVKSTQHISRNVKLQLCLSPPPMSVKILCVWPPSPPISVKIKCVFVHRPLLASLEFSRPELILYVFSCALPYCQYSYFLSYVGDGGEDVCCTLENVHLEETNKEAGGKFPANYVDEFINSLNCFFVGGLVYPSQHMRQR